jgi:transposase
MGLSACEICWRALPVRLVEQTERKVIHMALYVRELEEGEHEQLERLVQEQESDMPVQRLLIVLLSSQGRRVLEIGRAVDLHPINVRKWIHRFNADGIEGLRSGKSPGRPPLFTEKQRDRIVEVAGADPRKLGLPFSQWSLQRLRKFLVDDGIVDQISVETIRQILRSNGVRHRSIYGWVREKASHKMPLSSYMRTIQRIKTTV